MPGACLVRAAASARPAPYTELRPAHLDPAALPAEPDLNTTSSPECVN
jgi:hypothetical protein